MATNIKDFKVKHGLSVTGGGSFGEAVVVGEPTHGTHAATRGYVDSSIQDVKDILDPTIVNVATTANITISTALVIGQQIDGVTLTSGMTVLVKNQSSSSQNGIYVITATSPTRDPGFNSADNIFPGTQIYVSQGTAHGGSTWTLTSTPVTIGTDPFDFSFLGPLKAGTGITIDSTNTISAVGLDGTGFATITIDENEIKSLTSDITGSSLSSVGTLATLSVAGPVFFQENTNIGGTLEVADSIAAGTDLSALGTFTVFGTSLLQDNVSVLGNISATGIGEFDGGLSVSGQADFLGDLVVDGSFISNVGSSTTIDGFLYITGTTSISGTVAFTGAVTVPAPTQATHPVTKDYVDNLLNQESVEITTIDDLSNYFNGFESRFKPTYQGIPVTLQNPFNLLLTIDGIIQSVGYPDYVWQSVMPRVGFRIDNDGYIAFPEPIPQGSSFDARVLVGSDVTQQTKVYPFKAMDIVLGGY